MLQIQQLSKYSIFRISRKTEPKGCLFDYCSHRQNTKAENSLTSNFTQSKFLFIFSKHIAPHKHAYTFIFNLTLSFYITFLLAFNAWKHVWYIHIYVSNPKNRSTNLLLNLFNSFWRHCGSFFKFKSDSVVAEVDEFK